MYFLKKLLMKAAKEEITKSLLSFFYKKQSDYHIKTCALYKKSCFH